MRDVVPLQKRLELIGQAERFVQTFKDKLKALKCDAKDVQFELYKILMAYRRTIHPATGQSPSMLVFGRQMKSRLDLLVPATLPEASSRGEEDSSRMFAVNDRVAARDFLGSSKWKFGTVAERLGKLHYMVELDDGRIWKRHVDQMRSGPVKQSTQSDSWTEFFDRSPRDAVISRSRQLLPAESEDTGTCQQPTDNSAPDHTSNIPPTPDPEETAASSSKTVEQVPSETRVRADIVDRPVNDKNETPRRSTRIRKPPKRLDL